MSSPTTQGWTLFVAAFGMLLGLLAIEVKGLSEWTQATTPAFIGQTMAHVGVVIGAFVGGRLIPTGGDR